MIVRILGAAAGGGLPQWNCNCANCAAARAHSPDVVARTQTSIAVSDDGKDWVLLDATPDLRTQISSTPCLQPRPTDPLRSSPIKAVAVTGFEVDQIAGLLNLRESQPFCLYAAPSICASLRRNEIFNVLAPSIVAFKEMRIGEPFAPWATAMLEITAQPVPGKVPLPYANRPGHTTDNDGTVVLIIRDTARGTRMAYAPCCAEITDAVLETIDGVDLLLFDGTLYTDHELVNQGLSHKTGTQMGHVSMSGAEGSMARLHDVAVGRRLFIHLNNSNPVLRENSRERRDVVEAGWAVAYDGMELAV